MLDELGVLADVARRLEGAGMSSDTSPEMQKKYEGMLMALPAQRRVAMAASMFESCRKIQMSVLLSEGVPKNKWPGELFKRTYAPDFEPEKLEAIARWLDEKAAEKTGLNGDVKIQS